MASSSEAPPPWLAMAVVVKLPLSPRLTFIASEAGLNWRLAQVFGCSDANGSFHGKKLQDIPA